MRENSVVALKAHVALNVNNVEQSVEFYQKMLGIEPLKLRPGYAKFDVQNPPLNLTLNEGTVARYLTWIFRWLRPMTLWLSGNAGWARDW